MVHVFNVASDAQSDKYYDEYGTYLKQKDSSRYDDKLVSCIVNGLRAENYASRFDKDTLNDSAKRHKQFDAYLEPVEASCKSDDPITEGPDTPENNLQWIIVGLVGTLLVIIAAVGGFVIRKRNQHQSVPMNDDA